eukprot:1105668-Prymnesium_polylepis.1
MPLRQLQQKSDSKARRGCSSTPRSTFHVDSICAVAAIAGVRTTSAKPPPAAASSRRLCAGLATAAVTHARRSHGTRFSKFW